MRLGQKEREGWAGMETDRDGDSWRQGQGRGCRQEQRQGQRLRWRQTPILMRKNFRELCGLIIHGTKYGDRDGDRGGDRVRDRLEQRQRQSLLHKGELERTL